MGGLSIWHILIVAAAALLLFGGRGKISDLMGDVGKGIRSFKTGLSEADDDSDGRKRAPERPREIGTAVPSSTSIETPVTAR